MPLISLTVKYAALTALLLATASCAAVRAAEGPPGANWLERQVERRIAHQERELDWLQGDFNIGSGLASAAIVGIAVNRAAIDDPFKGLAGQTGEKGPVVESGENFSTINLATAYVTPLVARDYRGFAYMGLHNVASTAVTQALKHGVGQRRPGDQNARSFPSGHTNTAFVGAAFMQQRYGSRWGVPSYLSALLVGWSRVYGNKHYVNDIVSGASLAMISAWAIVPPYDAARAARWRDLERFRRFRYEWGMTLNRVDRNTVQAPLGTGDAFRSPLDTDANEPWANSHVALEYRVDEIRSVHAVFSPWEIRSFGQFTSPTSFANTLFPANEDLRVAHLMWTFGAQYRQVLLANERFGLRGGLGLAGQYTEEEVFVVDETRPEKRGLSASSDARAWYAVVHVDGDLRVFRKLYFTAAVDSGFSDDNHFLDWKAGFTVRVNSKWDVNASWREFETDLKDDALRNDFVRSGMALSVGYAF